MKSPVWLAAAFTLIGFLGCSESVEQTVASAKPATTRLVGIGVSCTAFSVGDSIFITSAHCLKDQPLVWLEDQEQDSHIAEPVVIDVEKDIATVIMLNGFGGPALKISQADPQRGQQIVTVGYPAYYGLSLLFEVDYVKDLVLMDGVATIIAGKFAYSGYSGGPVLLTSTGEVVGVLMGANEQIRKLPEDIHQHESLSFIIGAPEIQDVLARTQELLNK